MLLHLAMAAQELLFEDYYTMQGVSGLVELLENRSALGSTQLVLKSQAQSHLSSSRDKLIKTLKYLIVVSNANRVAYYTGKLFALRSNHPSKYADRNHKNPKERIARIQTAQKLRSPNPREIIPFPQKRRKAQSIAPNVSICSSLKGPAL